MLGGTELAGDGLGRSPEGVAGSPRLGRVGSPGDSRYLKVRWLWLQRRPVSAYRFRRMLDFVRAPNWSGTPQRGRFIHLPGGHRAAAQPTAAGEEGVRAAGGAPRKRGGTQLPRETAPMFSGAGRAPGPAGKAGAPGKRSCRPLTQEDAGKLTPWSPRPGRR